MVKPKKTISRGKRFGISHSTEVLTDEVLRQLETILEEVETELLKFKLDSRAELERLTQLEEEEYQRQRIKYPIGILNMTIFELDKYWRQEKETENEGWEEEGRTKMYDKLPPLKIIARRKKTKRRSNRKSGLANITFFRVPLRPKFLVSGIKSSAPRPGRVGEYVYSENGSPVVVIDSNRFKLTSKNPMISLEA